MKFIKTAKFGEYGHNEYGQLMASIHQKGYHLHCLFCGTPFVSGYQVILNKERCAYVCVHCVEKE